MSFYETIRAAIADFLSHGYDSEGRLLRWMDKIQAAAKSSLAPEGVVTDHLRDSLTALFDRHTSRKALVKRHKGISEFKLAQIKPKLRDELDRRILASASLIRLNREASIRRTLDRFSGWATAIPAGGQRNALKRPVEKRLRKAFTALPFEERRVIVDQGHKLVSAINDIVAKDGGAIASIWHSHWRETGYDYRPRHKQFDQRVFLVRDSWALQEGLIRRGARMYEDQIERPAALPFCRCYYESVYSPADLPEDMLTQNGKEWVRESRTRAA